MGKLHRVKGALACALWCACSSRGAPRSEAQTRAEVAAREAQGDAALVDTRFDDTGQLVPSGKRISWLELPSGFHERPGSTPRAAVLEAEGLPMAKVRSYLDARLVPEKLDFPSNGIAYRNAGPSHTRLEMPHLHVTLLELDRKHKRLRLLIDDLSPPPEPPLPVDVAAKELARERSRRE